MLLPQCNVSLFAEHVCLCIPTNTDDSKGVKSYETVPMHNNSHNAMAEAVLVSPE